jgi:hypothetical protein
LGSLWFNAEDRAFKDGLQNFGVELAEGEQCTLVPLNVLVVPLTLLGNGISGDVWLSTRPLILKLQSANS